MSVLEAIDYIHVMLNLYIKVSKFAMLCKCNETFLSMGVALVMKCVVKEINVIRLR